LQPNDVLDFLHSTLPDSLLVNYGLSKFQTENVSDIGEIIRQLIDFVTDSLFAGSHSRFNMAFAEGTGKRVLQYCFDRGDQFEGPLKGTAHHAIDLEYLFGNFIPGFADEVDVRLSETLMKFWIEFANGTEVWADYKTGKALHIKTDGTLEIVPRQNISSRRWGAHGELEKNWLSSRKVADAVATGNVNNSTF